MEKLEIKNIIKDRTGYGATDRIYFTVVANRRLTDNEREDIQIEQGFHPFAYGMLSGHYHNKNNEIVTTWACRASTGD